MYITFCYQENKYKTLAICESTLAYVWQFKRFIIVNMFEGVLKKISFSIFTLCTRCAYLHSLCRKISGELKG